MKLDNQKVLLVIPEENIRNVLAEALHAYESAFSCEIVSTVQEARDLLSTGSVQAIIMTKSAALSGDDGMNGLMTLQADLPPTITLIQDGDFPDYLYAADTFNDWCTMPFSLDELFSRLSALLERANKQHKQ